MAQCRMRFLRPGGCNCTFERDIGVIFSIQSRNGSQRQYFIAKVFALYVYNKDKQQTLGTFCPHTRVFSPPIAECS